MENASKALIIAGAIVLSLVIISLGMFIFSKGNEVANSIDMNEQEILAFNNKFTPYEGESIRGGQVNALLQAVVASNRSVNDNGEIDTKGIEVISTDDGVKGFTAEDSIGDNFKLSKVKTGTYYKVELTLINSLVRNVTISSKK